MLASPEEYAAMLDGAAAGRYAFPAINVTSSQTLNAAMRGFAEAGSHGIVADHRRRSPAISPGRRRMA
jgi:fructose-bisphosphate aldolase, class II